MSELKLPDVMELRVHGVHGTPPETMLGDPAPKRVAGDDMARFFRRRGLISARSADGKVRRRGVEAFHWGRFTSGSPSRALWLAMVPFALLNLSRYALLLPAGKERTCLPKLADGVLRLLGVVLTLMLVTTTAYVSIEILMHQCADSAFCRLDNKWLNYVAPRQFGPRLLLGAVPPLALVLLFWWFGRQSFLYEPRGSLNKWTTPNGAFDDHAFWHTSPKAPILRAMHVAAACATLGLLFAAFLHPRWKNGDFSGNFLVWGGLLLAAVLVIVAVGPEPGKLEADPSGRDPVKLPVEVTIIRWMCVTYLLVSGGVTSVVLWSDAGVSAGAPLPGFEAAPNIEAALAAALLLILLVTCGFLRMTSDGKRHFGSRVPKAFRPLWQGFGTWVIAAFATALAMGFSGGLVFRIADFVGKPVVVRGTLPVLDADDDCCREQWPIQLGASHWTGALCWGGLAALIVLALLPLAAAVTKQYATSCLFGTGVATGGATLIACSVDVGKLWVGILAGVTLAMLIAGGLMWWLGWERDGLAARARADYEPESDPRAIRRTTTTWRLALTKYRYHWGLTLLGAGGGLLVLACGVVAVLRMAGRGHVAWLDAMLVSDATDIGAWVLSGLLSLLVLLGIRSWQGAKLRTAVGVLWDLVAFWPRLVHPICPPPYGGRAVLQTAARAHYLTRHCNAVVLSGHSQGSVVCAAAVSVIQKGKFPEQPDPRVTLGKLGMVSYGSQLQWAYPRVFPAYLGYARIRTLWAEHLKERWRNVYRWTDPLGGPVLTWPHDGTPWPDRGTSPFEGMEPVPRWVGLPDPAAKLTWEKVPSGSDGAFGWKLGSDIRLRDPEFLTESEERPRSPLRGHGGYYDDPVFDVVVADLAAKIEESPS